jgi:Protein of unknown function (DUF559)
MLFCYMWCMTNNERLLFREPLLAAGFTRSAIQHRVDSGRWARVFNGIYLPSDTRDPDARRVGWHAAVLARGGPQSVLSHDTAAIHHELDSTIGWDVGSTYVTVPNSTRSFLAQSPDPEAFPLTVHRTRLVPAAESTVVDPYGLRFTGRARTLLDVAAKVDSHEFSIVLESGLRGVDPKRPDDWREDVLAELCSMVDKWSRKPGTSTARIALARRIPGRPTGSIADTTVLLALLAGGINGVIVQPRVLAPDRQGRVRIHFADLLIPAAQLIIEIDGGFHDLPERRKLDHERDRRLSPGFHVFRYPATVALFEPQRIVREVKSHMARAVDLGNCWELMGFRVEGSDHNWSITDSRRA